MTKRTLSETDICDKFITPAIQQAGWDLQDQIFREYTLRPGRVVVRGSTSRRDLKSVLRADYVLCHKANIPLAVIEAKDNKHATGAGMAQAINYAQLLEVPFSFSSNGDGFVFRDQTLTSGVLETNLTLDNFPSPAELWQRYCAWKGWDDHVTQVTGYPYSPSKTPRYYQINAINRTVEAIARGQQRALLVMATGTGKTYTAFQIIWRLWKSGTKKRILFLADRNILIDQTMVNDFRPFKGAMAKLSPNAKGVERVDAATGNQFVEDLDLAVNKTTKLVDKSYEIYLSLYQAVSGTEEEQNIYKQFSPDFFDLIVVDECHRGSADEDSAWREILTYFHSATHVGLTATPKETKETSNTGYFGEPVYTYSLRQGIEDGYLAPYKVIRVDLDKDVFGWRPPAGMTDKHGHVIEDRIYNATDMNRKLVLEKRDEVVAAKITEYLKATNRYDKTIVFCEDIDHAARMRQALSNANADICADHPRYVVQITGDNPEGNRELDNFIDPDKPYPVIAKTSKLMSTGVDAQTCKLIVLDQNIKSMTAFKQIIGRGTRLREDLGKTWFTILDFKRATDNFADPTFDGDPVQIYEPGPGAPVNPPEPTEDPSDRDGLPHAEGPKVPSGVEGVGDGVKRYIVGGMVTVSVARERVQYLNAQGQLITESLRDYTRINLTKQYDSLDKFLQAWSDADRKAALLEELEGQGVLFDALADEVGKDLDPFDLLLHVAFNMQPLTRRERANRVRKRNVFTQYGPVARKVIEALIDKYADEGVATIESMDVLLAEQSRIVTRVEELMCLCDALEAKGRLQAAQHAQLVSTLLGTLTDSQTPEALAANWQRIATHFDVLLDRPEAVDALEQTILQLAVRGLLVPQNPADEPASVLLQQIRAEKDRLIAEGSIKRDKPLPAIAEKEKPCTSRPGWTWVRLEDISVALVDCPHSTAKFVSTGFLCIDTNSFKNGKLLPHKARYVDGATFTERNARLEPQPGDLVFAREGSVGESVIIPAGAVACLGQRVMLFRFSSQISNEFVRLAITSKGFLDGLLALHKGIGAKHVNVGDMRMAVIPLPPLAEQSRIVARVEALRRLCADLRQRLSASQTTQAHLAEVLAEQAA